MFRFLVQTGKKFWQQSNSEQRFSGVPTALHLAFFILSFSFVNSFISYRNISEKYLILSDFSFIIILSFLLIFSIFLIAGVNSYLKIRLDSELKWTAYFDVGIIVSILFFIIFCINILYSISTRYCGEFNPHPNPLLCTYNGTLILPFVFSCLAGFIFYLWLTFERRILPVAFPNSSIWADTPQTENLLDLDESISLEFKASFDIPLTGIPEPVVVNGKQLFKLGNISFASVSEVNRHIQTQALKSIVGFLNSNGGRLVIGVHERDRKKEIIGLEHEKKYEDTDKYQRHLEQQIINRIGQKFCAEYIDINFINSDGKIITLIKVNEYRPKRGEIPAMLDGKHLYQRTGARTDKIPEGEPTARFISERLT